MEKIVKNSWMLWLFGLLLACQNHKMTEQTKDIDHKGWHKDSLLQLTFQPEHAGGTYDIFFLVRNDNRYPYANLFLIATIENGRQKIIDTLEYEMADAEGNWLGSGIWDLKESKLIYKKNYQPADTLPLHITVQQAVRKPGQIAGDEYLPGIKTIGIIIEEKTE